MRKILAVARWEYVERLKSKAFLIGLFLTPILLLLMPLTTALFAGGEDHETKVIGLIDETGTVAGRLAKRMEARYTLANGQPTYLIRVLSSRGGLPPDSLVAKANREVASGLLEGYCLIRGLPPADTTVEYRSKSVGDFSLAARIEENLKSIIAEERAARLGISPGVLDQLRVPLNVQLIKLSKSGEREEGDFLKVFYTSLMFQMMLLLMIVTSGQVLVRSVLEEKNNRIVEMLVSSCSADDLMAGKVVGLSGLGFTQLAFWTLIGVAVSVQFGISIIATSQALLLALYFVLGYLLYSAVFIAAGSPLTTEQAAQQITTYLTMILVLPIALAIPAMRNPDAVWLKVFSYFPLLTPTMMALRIPVQMPGPAEIVVTIVLMIGSTYLMMVAAGRIFRVAILSTGKTPRLAEVIRWARTG